MSLELNLHFLEPSQLMLKLGKQTLNLPFTSPLSTANHQDIRWYLEVYATQYATDVDDQRAERVANRLPHWGNQLFDTVFSSQAAQQLFQEFQTSSATERLLSISSSHPSILSLPWELLHQPNGTYLFENNPPISLRRRLVAGNSHIVRVEPKKKVRLLFIVSRPDNAGFMDPRLEPQAVMAALAQAELNQVEVEFLRPPTLANLADRLHRRGQHRHQSPVDIVHFDGHGIFEPSCNLGYLLFEAHGSKQDLVSPQVLGEVLRDCHVGLMVLSACQSAAEGNEAAIGSVAAQLTNVGVPAVLAMTYSVLLETTRQLFAAFYHYLVAGSGIGAALDRARWHLYSDPVRGERQRGREWITLRLYDWFLPALYQVGQDTPLLVTSSESSFSIYSKEKERAKESSPLARNHNLPSLKGVGFWGRSRELWEIERAFVRGARRVTITGFGGQGKTYLAVEAGQWLYQTGMFQKVCLVDYVGFQNIDAIAIAVSTLGIVLNESLIGTVATQTALERQSTLLILDNLESLDLKSLQELLDWAKQCSEAGDSRVLLTTRIPDLGHAAYPVGKNLEHVYLRIKGLGSEQYPEDGLNYFQKLMQIPPTPKVQLPEREALINLFAQVSFHPLSIGLLAGQLKERSITSVKDLLDQNIQAKKNESNEDLLIALLNLSLYQIEDNFRKYLPRLGVFNGGAMENLLLGITGLGKIYENPDITRIRDQLEMLKTSDINSLLRARGLDLPEGTVLPEEYIQQVELVVNNSIETLSKTLKDYPKPDLANEELDDCIWLHLRSNLIHAGLIQAEQMPGTLVPYLKFHPMLAPVLWRQLTATEQCDLLARKQSQYYHLSEYLYTLDDKDSETARFIALRELPNLINAAQSALDSGEKWSIRFVRSLDRFFEDFSLNKTRRNFTRQLEQVQPDIDKNTWYLAQNQLGDELLTNGDFQAAREIFKQLLAGLGEIHSYERCMTLGRLGRCFKNLGNPSQAAEFYRQELTEFEQLSTDIYQREIGITKTDLADVLRDMGDYESANQAYNEALEIAKIKGDERQIGVIVSQLGSLFIKLGDFAEAEQHYRKSLNIFQRLKEPISQAVALSRLGEIYMKTEQWNASERAYRQAVQFYEIQGNVTGAVQTWNSLGLLNQFIEQYQTAEAWYRKAIRVAKSTGNLLGVSLSLHNLATLLQSQFTCQEENDLLTEAQQLATESLAIKQKLDSPVTEIWTTYEILARISVKQGDRFQSRIYRRQARQAWAEYGITQNELYQHYKIVILGVVASINNPEVKQHLKANLSIEIPENRLNFVSAIQKIMDGERNEDVLVELLDFEESMIVIAILQGIENIESLKILFGDDLGGTSHLFRADL